MRLGSGNALRSKLSRPPFDSEIPLIIVRGPYFSVHSLHLIQRAVQEVSSSASGDQIMEQLPFVRSHHQERVPHDVHLHRVVE